MERPMMAVAGRGLPGWALPLLVILLLASACEPRSAEQAAEQRILELEAQVEDLEARLTQAWLEMHDLSSELTTDVRNLEAAVDEVERRVIDIHTADLQFTVPEIQASVAVAKQRLATVQQTTGRFARSVAP